MAANQNRYTDEYRRETADYVISTGRPVAEMARELDINPKTLSKWVKDRRDAASGAASPAEAPEMREMRRRIRELEMENAFLKKAAAFFAKSQA